METGCREFDFSAIEALVEAADFSLKALGMTVAKATLRTTIEGSMMGTFHGVAETGMDPETWRKGIAEAISKLTEGTLEAGLEWAIMGVALGGPIALGGKLITRAQVGGMVKRLAAKGISTEGMTPSQIVRRCWAEELKTAGKVAEGELLEKMVGQEMETAEAGSLESKIGKDPASGGKKVDAAPATEAGGPPRGLPEERLGSDAWPSESEAQLKKWGAEEVPLPNGHKLMRVRERCYLCSERCPDVTSLYKRFKKLILDTERPSFRERLAEIGALWEKETDLDILIEKFLPKLESLTRDLEKAEEGLIPSMRTPVKIRSSEQVGNEFEITLENAEGLEVGKIYRVSEIVGNRSQKIRYYFEATDASGNKAGKRVNLDSNSTYIDPLDFRDYQIGPNESVIYNDFNIPDGLRNELGGLGSIIFKDAHGYLEAIREADGIYGHWTVSTDYSTLGGRSMNLDAFWDAVDIGMMSHEVAAFETITGQWAKKLGYNHVEIVKLEETDVRVIFRKKKL